MPAGNDKNFTSDPPNPREAAIWSLVESAAWVRRRVETIKILDSHHFERRVSIDVDVNQVLAVKGVINLDGTVSVPLAELPKGLLLDIDIRGPKGKRISLCHSDEAAGIAETVLTDWISENVAGEVPFEARSLVKMLDVDVPLTDPGPVVVDEMQSLLGRLGASPSALATLTSLEFITLVDRLRRNWLLVCRVQFDSDPCIISYRWIENVNSLNSFNQPLPDQAGGFATYFSLRARDVGTASREHIRVVAPSGTFLGSSVFVPSHVTRAETIHYFDRESPERLIFYTKGLPRQHYFVIGTVWPDLAGFKTPALLLPLISTIVLLLGGLSQLLAILNEKYAWGIRERLDVLERFQSNVALDPVFTLLVLVPGLMVAYIVRDNEHELRRQLLRKGRRLTLYSLIPLFISAIALLLPFRPLALSIIWIASSVVCLGICLGLWRFCAKISREYMDMREVSEQTKRRQLMILETQ